MRKRAPVLPGGVCMKKIAVLAGVCILIPIAARAQNVKVTALGAHTGEFCSPDRALLFEDPTGVRILFDPATTIAGSGDTRLGDIHAILVSHAHGDHIGNAKLNQDPGAPTAACASGVPTTPTSNSNTAEIAAG